ncbi:uncharacterized protein LOC144306642 [Canis aureus]
MSGAPGCLLELCCPPSCHVKKPSGRPENNLAVRQCPGTQHSRRQLPPLACTLLSPSGEPSPHHDVPGLRLCRHRDLGSQRVVITLMFQRRKQDELFHPRSTQKAQAWDQDTVHCTFLGAQLCVQSPGTVVCDSA